jgi:hypothetical protein
MRILESPCRLAWVVPVTGGRFHVAAPALSR